MKRMRVLFGQRRVMVLVTLTVLVLAAAALVASSASFTATSANPGNIFTAGSLTMSNDKAGVGTGCILTATNMKPGDTISGNVTLQNTGTVSGAFTLTKTLVGTDTVAFGTELQMTVQEYTDNTFTTPVAGGPLYSGAASGAITSQTLGTWAPSATHYYKVTVNWPAAGGGPDNTYMGASVTYRFQWDATSI